MDDRAPPILVMGVLAKDTTTTSLSFTRAWLKRRAPFRIFLEAGVRIMMSIVLLITYELTKLLLPDGQRDPLFSTAHRMCV